MAWTSLLQFSRYSSLRDRKLVIFSLAANFVLVPLLALGVLFIFQLSEIFFIGLFFLDTSAGAPLIPKLAQVAKGDTAFAVGLMVLLMVVTILIQRREPIKLVLNGYEMK